MRSRSIEFTQWFIPILEALRSLGGSAKPKEIAQWIATKNQLTDEVLQERYPKSGTLKFMNQLAWCRQYMIWEELLATSKHGIWVLSSKGWEINLSQSQVDEMVIRWSRYYQKLKASKVEAHKSESIADEFNSIQEDSVEIPPSNLLDILKQLSPKGFEHLCGRLLREYDFEDIQITQHSHDGGIDGYATLKLNPLVNMSVYFQCKRYDGTVPTSKVQEFVGVLETNRRSVEKGLIITTGTFAKSALEIESQNNKLELIDGETLVEMFNRKELGVVPEIIYRPDPKFFEEYRTMK